MLPGFFSFFHRVSVFFSFVFLCVFFFISMDLRGLIQIKKEKKEKSHVGYLTVSVSQCRHQCDDAERVWRCCSTLLIG